MFESEFKLPPDQKATLVSIVCDKFDGYRNEAETLNSLQELRELLKTLGVQSSKEYYQKKNSLEAGTVLGKGKLLEIADLAKEEGSKLLVFDFELTASQARNIKKLTELEVLDRNTVILEIFAKHAQTKDAKIQIEISRLNYLLPRLSSLWTHFHRQKGGIGVRGGEGEQQLEMDKRIIRERISSLKKQLKQINTSRLEQKKKRQDKAIKVALVGYTNAGKSSLMNALCKVSIKSEDKLFATLDSTYRTITPDTKPPMILIDTVGFISNLPASLIEGFKTTLESAKEADLLIIVCDVSNDNYDKHLKVTNDILEELHLSQKDQLIVFNKKDLLSNKAQGIIALRKYPNSFLISSLDELDVVKLRNHVINYFLKKQTVFDLFIPYSDGDAHSKILGQTNVIQTVNHDNGIFYRVRVPNFLFAPLNLNKFVLGPEESNKYLEALD